jgi:SAM-dependent methyltransferase
MVWDDWHTEIAGSPACGLLVRSELGLPPAFNSNSLLPWTGIADIAAALRLAPGSLVIDLACGRGGYGLEIIRRTAARLVGLDLSPVAVRAATASAAGDARFFVGDYTAAGLRDGCADAVMCIDAMQFAKPPLAGLRECHRLLAPGGRIAVTAWEALDPDDERLPERTRRMNLARDLSAAGFRQVEVTERPDWLRTERSLWEAAAAADPANDPGLASLRDEAIQTLQVFDAKRRVLATAQARPAPPRLRPAPPRPPATPPRPPATPPRSAAAPPRSGPPD